MTLQPSDIENQEFTISFRGYDKSEVRSYLERLAEQARTEGRKNLSQLDHEPVLSVEARADDELDVTDSGTTSISYEGDVDATVAEILRRAEATADQIRAGAERDAAQARLNAGMSDTGIAQPLGGIALADAAPASVTLDEDELGQIRAHAEQNAKTEADHIVAAAQAQADQIVAAAQAQADQTIAEAQTQAEELTSSAGRDAEELRSAASADSAAGAEELAEAQQVRADAERERETALAEAAEARQQVANLLDEARSQSAMIRAEAEEIIRTRVRKATDQAMSRVQHLRTTEDASRERIVAAQNELARALTRLDGEAPLELPDADKDTPEIVAEAAGKSRELDASTLGTSDVAHNERPSMPADGARGFGDFEQTPIPPFPGEELRQTPITQVAVTDVVDVSEVAAVEADIEPVSTDVADDADDADDAGDAHDAYDAYDATPEPAEIATSDDEAGSFDDTDSVDSGEQVGLWGRDPLTGTSAEGSDYEGSTDEASEDSVEQADQSEDALTRLIRNAMQAAVQSARPDRG